MKSYFLLLFVLFSSFISFGQDRKIIKIETNDCTGSLSLKMDCSDLYYDDLLKPGKYRFYLQIKNCKVTLMKNRLKNYKVAQEFINQIENDLSKYQVKHYFNGELLSNCDDLNGKDFSIFVNIEEE